MELLLNIRLKPLRVLILLLVMALLTVSCQSVPEAPYQDELSGSLGWKRAAFNRMKNNRNEPLVGRVQPMPADLFNALKDSDYEIGITSSRHYTTRAATEQELTLFQSYVALLPSAHQKIMKQKLLAVYLVNDFAGAGYSDWVIDPSGNIFYYLIINTAVFERSIDEWLTFRDGSLFDDSVPELSLKVLTGIDYKALLYALLHEGAHLVDYELGVTPFVDDLHRKVLHKKVESTAFTQGVWLSQGQPVEPYDFKLRKNMNIYGIYPERGKIAEFESVAMLEQLSSTPFVSFYAGSSWNEHLSDVLTYHHIEQFLGGKVMMELTSQGQLVQRYTPMSSPQIEPLKETLRVFYE